MIYPVIILSLTYAFLLAFLLRGWLRLKTRQKTEVIEFPYFSILVPARNEAANIGKCLKGLREQNYPKDRYEIIVINDASSDQTHSIVESYISENPDIDIQHIYLKDSPGDRSPKKRAIENGIHRSKGDWIVTTDADCEHPVSWLRSYARLVIDKDPVMISAPVAFHRETTFFEKIQSLEFSALVGIGGASIGLGTPTMCNGANLAYLKSAFMSVDGFKGNEHLSSGDDEFLLHKISKKYPGKIAFLKDPAAIVTTQAHKTFREFIEQRKRWVSKSSSYQNKFESLMAYFVWFYHLLSLLILLLSPLISGFVEYFVILFVTKLVAETLFVFPVSNFFKKAKYIVYYPVAAFLYLPYVSFIALLGKTKFTWKGRSF